MYKILMFAAAACIVSTSCSKEFTKKHEASFKVNGTKYDLGEDQVSASYYNGDAKKLTVDAIVGPSGANGVTILLDLNKIKQTVAIDSGQVGFSYTGTNGTVFYTPISGEWKITGHEEGNPASRHTEGTFSYTAVNPYNTQDTVRITEGSFYVNNY